MPAQSAHQTLSGKVVLITGAARRIGAALARSLHADGATVVVHYRSSRAEADALCGELDAALKYSWGKEWPPRRAAEAWMS